MSRREEFVGCRVVDHMTSDVACYAQWLTEEPIVRCRDCKNYLWRGHLGRSYCNGEYATDPDGFCAWGERRNDGQA